MHTSSSRHAYPHIAIIVILHNYVAKIQKIHQTLKQYQVYHSTIYCFLTIHKLIRIFIHFLQYTNDTKVAQTEYILRQSKIYTSTTQKHSS